MKKQTYLFQSKGDGLGLFDRKNRESNGRGMGMGGLGGGPSGQGGWRGEHGRWGGGGATRACMAKILAACSKNGMEKLGGDEWMHERNEWEYEHGGYGDGYVRIEEGMRWGDHARMV